MTVWLVAEANARPAGGAGADTAMEQSNGSGKRLVHILILLALCGLVWRAVLSFYLIPAWESSQRLAPFPDDYPALARSLIETHTLGFGPVGGASPTTLRGPGYPLWLALGMLAGGYDARWLGLWSSLPMLLLAPIAGLLAARRYGAVAGVGVAVILLFHPLPGKLSARVMSDEFFAACGLAAILAWDAGVRSTRVRPALLLAIAAASLLAMQMLTRATGLFFLIVVAVLGLWPGHPRRALTLFVVVVALIPPLLWSVRSSRLEGRVLFVHSLNAYNFWIGEGFDRYGYGWMRHETWWQVTDLLRSVGAPAMGQRREPRLRDLTPAESASLERNLQRAAVDRIVTDPFGYVGRVARGIHRFWIESDSARTSVLYAVAVLPLLCLAIVACFRVYQGSLRPDRIIVASVTLVVLHNLCYAGTLPLARFSAHVYPELAWLVGCALSRRGPASV